MSNQKFDISQASDAELDKAASIPEDKGARQEKKLTPAEKAMSIATRTGREITENIIHGDQKGIPAEIRSKIIEAQRQAAVAEMLKADPNLSEAEAKKTLQDYEQMFELELSVAAKGGGQKIDLTDAEIAGFGEQLEASPAKLTTERSAADQLKLARSEERRAEDVEAQFQADTEAMRQNAEVLAFVEKSIRTAEDKWNPDLPGKKLELAVKLGGGDRDKQRAAMQAIETLIDDKIGAAKTEETPQDLDVSDEDIDNLFK